MVTVGILIQARLNSSRLPGKVLLPLPDNSLDTTLLDQVIKRAMAVVPKPIVVLATSRNVENDPLDATAAKNHIPIYRGDEDDVLARFYEAATTYNLDVIIRLTADNPFIDPAILSETLSLHLKVNPDLTYTTGLPLGTNLEIINYQALKKAHKTTLVPEHREHVTPYIRQNPGLFNIHHQEMNQAAYGLPHWRLTVDNENDYALASIIYMVLEQPECIFALSEVATLLHNHPALLLINHKNYQKKVFNQVEEELKEAVDLLQENSMPRAADVLKKHLN